MADKRVGSEVAACAEKSCNEPQWWLAQTKPQMERRLARELRSAGITHELLIEHTFRYERDADGRVHRRKVDRVYFPGYLFIQCDDAGRYHTARSKATARLIAITDQAGFEKQLASVRLAVSVDPSLRMVEGLSVGRFARVLAGPFAGVTGTVEKLRSGRMIVQIGISMMGHILPLEIPAEYVELE